MKICVHIANNCVTTDNEVMVIVECDGVPRQGDLFYIPKDVQLALERQAKKAGGYDGWYYKKGLSFDDAIYVEQVSWEISLDNVYRCHIELGDKIRYE